MIAKGPQFEQDAERGVELARFLREHRRLCPADFYEPHHTCFREGGARPVGAASGQLQFHQSLHTIRVAAPGNGWGGTMSLACEVDAWARHTNRWQETPAEPLAAIWFTPKYQQYEILRRKMFGPKVFGALPKYKVSHALGAHYEWPDGGFLCLGSYDSDWTRYQGVEPHLMVFDEIPPVELWRESMQRSRGETPTRFICKATQTQGRGWMAEDVYGPWLEHHELHGHDEQQAADLQLHPDIWCWPFGGIHDNPYATDRDVGWYLRQKWQSEKERKVRIWGGFEDWAGDSVFDAGGLERLKERAAALTEEFGEGLQGVFTIDDGDDLPPIIE